MRQLEKEQNDEVLNETYNLLEAEEWAQVIYLLTTILEEEERSGTGE